MKTLQSIQKFQNPAGLSLIQTTTEAPTPGRVGVLIKFFEKVISDKKEQPKVIKPRSTKENGQLNGELQVVPSLNIRPSKTCLVSTQSERKSKVPTTDEETNNLMKFDKIQ